MCRVKFTLPIWPQSINDMYYSNKRHGLTAKAREWLGNTLYSLHQNRDKLALIRESFDAKKQGIAVYLIWKIPKDILYTKSGELSSRSIDITNAEKSLVDAIFLPKFYGANVPYQCENLNLDDRYLRRLFSEKQVAVGQDYSVDVTLKLIKK